MTAPDVMWTMEAAQRACLAVGEIVGGYVGLASDSDECQMARALEALVQAHAPRKREAFSRDESWLGRPVFVPAHAVCSGACWDAGRDTPAAWPCPGMRPVLDSLGLGDGEDRG